MYVIRTYVLVHCSPVFEYMKELSVCIGSFLKTIDIEINHIKHEHVNKHDDLPVHHVWVVLRSGMY